MAIRRTALITGASGGIGLDLAHVFAREGWHLVLVARTEEKLRSIAAQIEKAHGVRVTVLPADLASDSAPVEIAATVASLEITVDALVNNAGFGLQGAFVETDASRELEMIRLNVTALTHLTKLFLPQMVERRSGYVMNVASTAAFQPGPLMAVYYATKAYVLSFSEAIAEEVASAGVKVSALCPGATATGFADAAAMTNSRLFKAKQPMSSRAVAEEGYRGLMKGKRVVVTGALNKLFAQGVRISPRSVVTKVTRALNANG